MIKYTDLGISEDEFEQEISPRLKTVFLSGEFICDTQVKVFEDNFAAYCGSRFAIAVNSGTDALIFSLNSIGVGEADEVITVSNSFIATANAIAMVGAKPVFVDINENLLIDASKIEAAITEKTKAIMPVHLMGHVCDMDSILSISKKHDIPVIEDAAQSVGSMYKNFKTGTFGKTGCFSLHPLKNLSGITDGGIIVTDDEDIAEYLRQIRNNGLESRDKQKIIGRVSRLNSLNAVILEYRLKKIQSIISKRRVMAELYNKLLNNCQSVSLIDVPDNIYHTYHTYIIKVKNRAALQKYLAEKEIETKIHYPVLIHNQAPFNTDNGTFSLDKTTELSSQILTLPISMVNEDEVNYICQTIIDFYADVRNLSSIESTH